MCRNMFVEAVESEYEVAKVFEKRRARPLQAWNECVYAQEDNRWF